MVDPTKQTLKETVLTVVEIVAANYGATHRRWHILDDGEIMDLIPYGGVVPKPEDRIPMLELPFKPANRPASFRPPARPKEG